MCICATYVNKLLFVFSLVNLAFVSLICRPSDAEYEWVEGKFSSPTGSKICGSCVKSDLFSAFVNKVLLEYNHDYSFTY